MYTETERRRIHGHFYHPSTDKVYVVIKGAEPRTTNSGMYDSLDNLRNNCNVSQRNSAEPNRFRVFLPADECVLNHTVSMEIMSLDSRSVLKIVDRDTKCGAACFLKEETASDVRKELVNGWVYTYVGYHEFVSLDQSPQLQIRE